MELTALVPFSAGDLVDEVHRHGTIRASEFTEHGTKLTAVVSPQLAGRLRQYVVEGTAPGLVGRAAV